VSGGTDHVSVGSINTRVSTAKLVSGANPKSVAAALRKLKAYMRAHGKAIAASVRSLTKSLAPSHIDPAIVQLLSVAVPVLRYEYIALKALQPPTELAQHATQVLGLEREEASPDRVKTQSRFARSPEMLEDGGWRAGEGSEDVVPGG
jgi:hypothetical protein